MTPEQALTNIVNVLRDDRLRFLNYREFAAIDESIMTLGKLIKKPTPQTPPKKANQRAKSK